MIKSTTITAFIKALCQEKRAFIPNLWDTPTAIIAIELNRYLNQPVLIITGRESGGHIALDFSTLSSETLLEYPAWESLPDEDIPPSLDIVGKRLEILSTLSSSRKKPIIIAPLQAVLQKLPPKESLHSFFLKWKCGAEIPFETIASTLERLGYTRRPIVSDKGEFALRGGIVDIFSISESLPSRLDFYGDTLEEIRTFDPSSQKSIEKKKELFIPPTHEHRLLQQGHLTTFFDYFPQDPIILFDDLYALENCYVRLKDLPTFRSQLMLTFDELLKITQSHTTYFGSHEPLDRLSNEIVQEKDSTLFPFMNTQLKAKQLDHPFEKTTSFFPEFDPIQTLTFYVSSDAEEKALQSRCEGAPLPPTVHFERGYLSSGIYLPQDLHAWIPYAEISGRHKVHRQKWRETTHTPASEFHEMSPGDYIVHLQSGIGKFVGIEKQKSHEGIESDFFVIEYAEGGRLFVPLSQSHLISRYIGSHEEKPTLHKIGDTKWNRAKISAQKSIIGYAKDLLTAQAEREHFGGHACPSDSEDMLLFEEEFPFTETEDQLKAIKAIKDDLQSDRPMDRLVCGDVGYGKTEVAMRAAFKMVVDGCKQVAILVPTTTLAMQHYDTFCSRMSSFPISIRILSRFQSRIEIKEALRSIEKGAVDIVIGTHRIISKDVRFKDLGLVVIDEEQRFGVRAKESLKKFAHGVDYLTLSATPIPRTLYLSLVNARDLSVINTPPQDRLPIKTIIAEKESTLIKNACLRELAREGQVYYVHNRVESIHKITQQLQELLPHARIKPGHGQMHADELDDIFHSFKAGTIDILVATTIIENGIDIPNANTILIERADTFGIADLYQLRGRVGRWNRPAYAYFLTPPNRELPEISQKRLQALASTSGFGGGMKLAMRDLEIRGAGDILGTRQSGMVSSIGFHLYCKLLRKTIDAIKKKKPVSWLETKMEFPFDATLPETYIEETSIRLEIFHRLGEAESNDTVEAIRHELIDRFGSLPDTTNLLLHLTRIRIAAQAKGYTLLKYDRQTLITQRKSDGRKTHILQFFKTPAEFEAIVLQVL